MTQPQARSNRTGPQALVRAALAFACAVSATASAGPLLDEINGSFVKHLAQTSAFDEKAREFIADQWAKRSQDYDADAFIVESLALLSPDFTAGLDAYDDDDYEKAFRTMLDLIDQPDPYLSANAAFFAVKALVEQDKLEEAAARLQPSIDDPTPVDLYTAYAAEVSYLHGYLLLRNLEYRKAAAALRRMLEQHPDAPRRMRVTAQQMLAELRNRVPQRIGDVADLMTYSGRRLGHRDSGERVRKQQQRAIELLDQLIEEAEKKEQSGGGGGGSGSSGKRAPQTPMQESQLPGGGPQGTQLRSTRKVKPGEEWGSMPPAERDRILQSLRDGFPDRYRRLIEQYYRELSRQP